MRTKWYCMLAALAFAMLAQAAEPQKTLRYILPAAETSLDPAVSRDLYTGHITQAIFDTLYTYDYLARPVKLAPAAAAALPEVSADGKTYTIRLKKGQLFTPDPAFGGKPRELTMADFVYSWKRLLDPRLASPHAWLFEGKVVGLDALAAEAAKSGRLDYDKPVAGFELLDPYTLRIHLTQTDFNLGMILAHEPTAAVAREIVKAYGDSKGEVHSNPVGTGYYRLAQWTRGSKIVLEKNPHHLPETWDFQPGSDPDDQRIVQQMKGKAIPQIDRIEITVLLEDQTRWLSFTSGGADLFWLDGPLAPKAMLDGGLRPELKARGIQLSRQIDPELTYYYINGRDPVLGGYSKEKIALRRAVMMAHNVDEEIRLVWNNQALRLDFPAPPGVVGHDPAYRSSLQYDPALANKLLDKFGYRKGADGWRTLPDGKPLVVRYTSRNEASGVLLAELWRKTYNSLSIRMENDRLIFTDILQAEKECKLQSRNYQWVADFPDGDNFMQLFYGPNINQNNNGCFENAEYDRLYEQTRGMPAGPERDALYRKMARIIEVQGGGMMGYARYRNMLAQPSVLGYRKHPILHQEWAYIDIDRSKEK
ncbi:ABC transporter substrate-binding protein [Massilia endophytica]|uniref:ABC transporter substrate-binding protein n=1 Tax=Massilia endophytica TaxID=2899220 RepID=UPI001E2FBCE1|nr:ABC transporter substrate-binding protein [Massilia endophytica]UGQ47372.1 ABC transporter substrate-binding protein [Massilia endophytica]